MKILTQFHTNNQNCQISCSFCTHPATIFVHKLVYNTSILNYTAKKKQLLHYSKNLDHMINSYHDASLIRLEDNLKYGLQQQNLKRVYQTYQYKNKINMLTQYYKFHHSYPSLFMKQISSTINPYIVQKRKLQYQKIINIVKINKEGKLQKKHQKQRQKLLGQIELSYQDFEKKQNKVQNQKQKKNVKFKNKQKKNIGKKKLQIHCESVEKNFSKKYSVNISTNRKLKKVNDNYLFSKRKSHSKSCKGLQNQKSRTNLSNNHLISKCQEQKLSKIEHNVDNKNKNLHMKSKEQQLNKCNSKILIKKSNNIDQNNNKTKIKKDNTEQSISKSSRRSNSKPNCNQNGKMSNSKKQSQIIINNGIKRNQNIFLNILKTKKSNRIL